MDCRIILALAGILFALISLFLVIYIQTTNIGFDIVCDINRQYTNDENYPVLVSWSVHADHLYGPNAAIYSAQICDPSHCIDRTTILTIRQDQDLESSNSTLVVCPVSSIAKVTSTNWKRLERLDHKRAIIINIAADKVKLWSKTKTAFEIENLIGNGTTHSCIWDGFDNFKHPSLLLFNFRTEGVSTSQQILLTSMWIFMALSAVACAIALGLCIWRCWYRRSKSSLYPNAWMNRVSVTWPDVSTIPALADKFRVPNVEVERFQMLPRRQPSEGSPIESFDLPFDAKWEFNNRKGLQLGHILGIGAFGKFILAKIETEPFRVKTLVVKMLKQSFTTDELKNLICEMEALKMLGDHENLINLLGCCTSGLESPFLVMEFAEFGSLQAFLKRESTASSLTYGRQISFTWQIAKGMQFLAQKKCVHRSLASRNVLITSDYKVKISNHASYLNIPDADFTNYLTSRNVMAMRWLAPESLSDNIFDTKSDVWSYGIVLWEIMSLGATPYPKLGGDRDEMKTAICSGYQMEQPAGCTDQMYKVMESCWSFHSFNRPTFDNLVEIFHNLQSVNDVGLWRPQTNGAQRLMSRSTSVYYQEQPPADDLVDFETNPKGQTQVW